MNLFLQLILILLALIVLGAVALVIKNIITTILNQSHAKLKDRNVSISKSGAKIGVKARDREDYLDSTQKVLVDAWNKSSTEGYKSWFSSDKKKS